MQNFPKSEIVCFWVSHTASLANRGVDQMTAPFSVAGSRENADSAARWKMGATSSSLYRRSVIVTARSLKPRLVANLRQIGRCHSAFIRLAATAKPAESCRWVALQDRADLRAGIPEQASHVRVAAWVSRIV